MSDRLTTYAQDTRRITPMRAVLHPAWLLAVFVLLVNDHIVKPAAFAETIAGKVSDFAGLFFFPILLAALLGVQTRRGLLRVAAAVGVVFAAINVSPEISAAFDRLVSHVTPFATTTDPTDLIALVALPVGLWFFDPVMASARAGQTRRALEAAAVTLGGLASLATSPPPCDGDDCFVTTESSQVSILNMTNELHVLRVRPLREGVALNCDTVARDPAAFLSPAVFGAPETWMVQSGQEIPLRAEVFDQFGQPRTTNARCRAVLVESDTTPHIVAFWDASLPVKSFAFDADIPREIPADAQTIVLDADYSRAAQEEMHAWRERSDCGERADLCNDEIIAPLATIPTGARYFWRSQHDTPLHYVEREPVGTIPNVEAQCQVPGAADGLAWEPPPSQERWVLGLEEGRDGCHEVLLGTDPTDPSPLGWWICAPIEALDLLTPLPDAPRRVAILVHRERPGLIGGWEGLSIGVFTERPDGSVTHETIHVSRGYAVSDEVDVEPRVSPIDGCDPLVVACGQVAMPSVVELDAYDVEVRPGESIRVGNVVPLDVHIVRAEARPVVDAGCEIEGTTTQIDPLLAGELLGYIEAVIVRREPGR